MVEAAPVGSAEVRRWRNRWPGLCSWGSAGYPLWSLRLLTFSAAKEIAYQINNSESKLLFLDPVLLPVYEQAESQIEDKLDANRVVLLCSTEQKPEGSPYKTLDEVIASAKPVPFATASGNEIHDTAWLCYSSGTTGLPKGVMTTHHNMTSQLQAVNASYQQLESGKDTVLGILPLSHIYGLTIILLQPLTVGVPVVVLPKFDEIPVLKAIQKFKVTHGLIVPPILIVLLHSQNIKNYDISSLVSCETLTQLTARKR